MSKKCPKCDGSGTSCGIVDCHFCAKCPKCKGKGRWTPEEKKFEPIERWLYSCSSLNGSYDENENMQRTDDPEEAILISSEIKGKEGMHAPAIDIDLPCRLVPSSTEGHFHLFIEKELTLEQYGNLLTVLANCGIIDNGFLNMFLLNSASFLRVRHKDQDPKG